MLHPNSRFVSLVTAALLAATLSACNRGGAAPAGPPGGMPPASVTLLTLQPKPVERASEFMATLRSLRSTTVQPEVEGSVTRIFVKSGDVVRAGTPLVQIDPDNSRPPCAAPRRTEPGATADVLYWRQQVARLDSLVTAGAVSKLSSSRPRTPSRRRKPSWPRSTRRCSEERVQLRYYRVVAPQAGVVGDIPIRVGDRVTHVERHHDDRREQLARGVIQVPVDARPSCGWAAGAAARRRRQAGGGQPISFVAPRVDDARRSVLVKSLLKECRRGCAPQFVRARVVWSTVRA